MAGSEKFGENAFSLVNHLKIKTYSKKRRTHNSLVVVNWHWYWRGWRLNFNTMKRSEINRVINLAKDFFAGHEFRLPPFAFWKPVHWQRVGNEANEIRKCKLGWDLTDFGSGDFARVGLTLFTLRNGKLGDPGMKKTYAEKIMMVLEEQVTPMHFHWTKTEDIINRGAGVLVVQLFNSTKDEQVDSTSPVHVQCDGVTRQVKAGGTVELGAGESITLTPGIYHQFHGKKGAGTVLVGEVSSVNDDATDNRFAKPLPRFPAIEEDEPPMHLLCNEYPPVR